ncbi:uncharacterized protein BJ171DRAFT_492955 [Polychytrium aggregatum]|uniref:uncharacterized protein n=1 Tax=Polychytrium aggregatum TaxID=110093 RepID=UPI0022FECC30|nr:uncharacterized protein BJ171DRAFT_492955 [Polychytrium aggregatum]KAI9207522.1 hypothetical protein BJ171DRAFT_492955 [Polychytrium aggregatum]
MATIKILPVPSSPGFLDGHLGVIETYVRGILRISNEPQRSLSAMPWPETAHLSPCIVPTSVKVTLLGRLEISAATIGYKSEKTIVNTTVNLISADRDSHRRSVDSKAQAQVQAQAHAAADPEDTARHGSFGSQTQNSSASLVLSLIGGGDSCLDKAEHILPGEFRDYPFAIGPLDSNVLLPSLDMTCTNGSSPAHRLQCTYDLEAFAKVVPLRTTPEDPADKDGAPAPLARRRSLIAGLKLQHNRSQQLRKAKAEYLRTRVALGPVAYSHREELLALLQPKPLHTETMARRNGRIMAMLDIDRQVTFTGSVFKGHIRLISQDGFPLEIKHLQLEILQKHACKVKAGIRRRKSFAILDVASSLNSQITQGAVHHLDTNRPTLMKLHGTDVLHSQILIDEDTAEICNPNECLEYVTDLQIPLMPTTAPSGRWGGSIEVWHLVQVTAQIERCNRKVIHLRLEAPIQISGVGYNTEWKREDEVFQPESTPDNPSSAPEYADESFETESLTTDGLSTLNGRPPSGSDAAETIRTTCTGDIVQAYLRPISPPFTHDESLKATGTLSSFPKLEAGDQSLPQSPQDSNIDRRIGCDGETVVPLPSVLDLSVRTISTTESLPNVCSSVSNSSDAENADFESDTPIAASSLATHQPTALPDQAKNVAGIPQIVEKLQTIFSYVVQFALAVSIGHIQLEKGAARSLRGCSRSALSCSTTETSNLSYFPTFNLSDPASIRIIGFVLSSKSRRRRTLPADQIFA